MKQKKTRRHASRSGNEAPRELGASYVGQPEHALMHADQQSNGGEYGYDLNGSDHGGRQYAGICFDRKAADVAKELAFMSCAAAHAHIPHQDVFLALARLIGSPPTDRPADALAFAATAKPLLQLIHSEGDNNLAAECVKSLVLRTVETLEAIVGGQPTLAEHPSVN